MKKNISFTITTFFISISLCACGQNIQISKSGYARNSKDSGKTIQSLSDNNIKGKRNIGREKSVDGAEVASYGQTVIDGEDARRDDSSLEEWKLAYLTYLDANEYADTCTYSLIYVNDDEIPELFIDTRVEAGGCQILTFYDHVLDEWQSNRRNVAYIERENLILNADGIYGYYFDNVYFIQNGKWVYAEGGTHGDGPDGIKFDENGNYIEFFNWDGEDLTEEEYEVRLNAIYPTKRSIYPQKYYILDEIRSILRTGSMMSDEAAN